jgi:hypothetical protein
MPIIYPDLRFDYKVATHPFLAPVIDLCAIYSNPYRRPHLFYSILVTMAKGGP